MLDYGGIYPITPPDEETSEEGLRCFHCGQVNPALDHYIEVHRMYMHGKCVEPFLLTEGGEKFLAKGYVVLVSLDGSLKRIA